MDQIAKCATAHAFYFLGPKISKGRPALWVRVLGDTRRDDMDAFVAEAMKALRAPADSDVYFSPDAPPWVADPGRDPLLTMRGAICASLPLAHPRDLPALSRALREIERDIAKG